jgi:hypothetical protein
MTPRYIVHVGPLKTASTYLQQCLTAARTELSAAGISYPVELADEHARFMHMPVFRALGRDRAESLRGIFAQLNASGHHTIVLSCEHLILLRPEALGALRDVTGASEIQIVYTCRRWSDRLSSLWNQTLFMGSTQSLPEFHLAMLAGGPPSYFPKWMRELEDNSDVDYSVSWRAIESVFGRAALKIFPYSTIIDRGGDIFEQFCQDVLGLPQAPPTPVTGTLRWASLPTQDQEILRMLNQLYIDVHGHESDATRARFVRSRKMFDTKRIETAMEPFAAALTIDDNNIQFDRAFQNMSAYGDCVLGGPALFERRRKPARYVQPGYLLRHGVREDLHEIYARIAAELDEVRLARRARK